MHLVLKSRILFAALYHQRLVCVKSGFPWSMCSCSFCGVKAARTKLQRTSAHRQTPDQSVPGAWGAGCLTEVFLSIDGSMQKILCSSALVWFLYLSWLLIKWSDTEAPSPGSTCTHYSFARVMNVLGHIIYHGCWLGLSWIHHFAGTNRTANRDLG